jgi:hypothetical protein
MLKTKYALMLAVLSSALVSLPERAQAQHFNPHLYVPMAPPPHCGYYAACTNDSEGNIIDNKTGDVYDRKGRYLRPGRSSSYSTPSYSSYDSCVAAKSARMHAHLTELHNQGVTRTALTLGNGKQIIGSPRELLMLVQMSEMTSGPNALYGRSC